MCSEDSCSDVELDAELDPLPALQSFVIGRGRTVSLRASRWFERGQYEVYTRRDSVRSSDEHPKDNGE